MHLLRLYLGCFEWVIYSMPSGTSEHSRVSLALPITKRVWCLTNVWWCAVMRNFVKHTCMVAMAL